MHSNHTPVAIEIPFAIVKAQPPQPMVDPMATTSAHHYARFEQNSNINKSIESPGPCRVNVFTRCHIRDRSWCPEGWTLSFQDVPCSPS
jgi:hypothetical protein